MIHYEEKGQGTPLLCIHGFDVDHRLMSGCIEPLFSETSDYRRIYLDLPGMGLSPANARIRNADEMLATLELFISEVIGDEDYLLAGQSYGGYLSLGLAYQQQKKISGLFLLCPCVVADKKERLLPVNDCAKDANFEVSAVDIDAFADFSNVAAVINQESWERYKKEIWPGLQAGDKVFTKKYQESGYAFSFDEKLKELTVDQQTFILTGKQDDIVGYEDAFHLSKKFVHGSFAVIDNAGHNLHLDQPERFADYFSDWISQVGI